jgi:hypothetical protein
VRTPELAHERDECVHALLRERVVDRRAQAADRPVALQAVEARRLRFLDELRFEFLARQPEVTFITEVVLRAYRDRSCMVNPA